MDSWSDGTKYKYCKPLEDWFNFCTSKNVTALNTTSQYAIEYLMSYYHKGLGYSAINNARSALSTIVVNPSGVSIGKDPLVCRFLKGVFRKRPSLPRYVYTWDVTIIFNYMRSLPPLLNLTLKQLTLSLTILLFLLSGNRCQAVHLYDLKHCHKTHNSYTFSLPSILKTTKPGKHLDPVIYTGYPYDKKLCVYLHLTEYISRTREIRGVYTPLLISYVKPHKPVVKDTVARWVTKIMQTAGIDTSIFAPHSTRSASTSAAFRQGCPMQTILKAGGWSQEGTFLKYYNKPVLDTLPGSILPAQTP